MFLLLQVRSGTRVAALFGNKYFITILNIWQHFICGGNSIKNYHPKKNA